MIRKGPLFKRSPKGPWWCDLGRTPRSKRDRRPLTTDWNEAMKQYSKLQLWKRANRYGHGVEDSPYETAKVEYLRHRARGKRNTATQDRAAFWLLERFFPAVERLQHITPKLLQEFQGALRQDGYPPTTTNRRVRSIKKFLKECVAWKLLSRDWHIEQDWTITKELKEPKGRLVYFDIDEMKRLGPLFKGPWETVLRLGHRAGMRRGEIHHAHKRWLHLERDAIRIQPTPCSCRCKDCAEHGKEWTPKDHEARTVYIPRDLVAYLSGLELDGFLVVDRNGQRPSAEVLSAYTNKLVRKARLKGGLHTLRHTYGAWNASAGMDMRRLMEQMGHSTIDQTMVYAHLRKTADHQANLVPAAPY